MIERLVVVLKIIAFISVGWILIMEAVIYKVKKRLRIR